MSRPGPERLFAGMIKIHNDLTSMTGLQSLATLGSALVLVPIKSWFDCDIKLLVCIP